MDSYIITIPDIVSVIGYPHTALVIIFVALQCLEFFVVATLWGAKCVKNTYKCYVCISLSDI